VLMLQAIRSELAKALAKVYREAAWLFARHDATSRFSEWPSLHADLKQLAAAATPHARLRVFERLMRNYKVFQR
ncbi:nuclear control of ATPase, partial [Haematococcus lacustris]